MTDDKNKECPLLRDTAFVDLMKRRIFNVLLIANPYDAFMLEDDGRVEEKIFDEYVKLGLRYPPRFFQVASQEEAEEELGKTSFDLISVCPVRTITTCSTLRGASRRTIPRYLSSC